MGRRSATRPSSRLRKLLYSTGWPLLAGLFLFLALVYLPPATPTAAESATNPAVTGCISEPATPVKIRHVIDGDTVILSDDTRTRLIGIDTPELGRDGRADEPLARAARERLEILLRQASQIRLRSDQEARDHYGRTLGHLYADGRNIQAALLKAGLATPLTIPPNLQHLECYQTASAAARSQQRGLWALPPYQPVASSQLTGRERGYRLVYGEVTRIGRSKSAIWINFGDNFALRIVREDLPYFAGIDFADWIGRTLTAQGVVEFRNNQSRMRIRHPANIKPAT
ncbi:MAG: thermonuclease family protein [Gammaproteobacteria bacterium]